MRTILNTNDIRPTHAPGAPRRGTGKPVRRIAAFVLKSGLASVVALGLLTLAPTLPSADTRWETYVSKHCTFTLLKPSGWF